jgi:dihydropteroate synthase
MGVLNVTPDSFFDGGRYLDTDAAVAHGLALVAQGADIIDVGGESSRPGAEPVDVDVEMARVIPVISALAGTVRVSVDTMKPAVAAAAVAAGASLINDISAAQWEVALASGSGWVVMHKQGMPPTMQDDPVYSDVVDEVFSFLLDRARVALEAGVGEVWVDPGIGFGKTIHHNLSLLRHLPELVKGAADLGCAGAMVGTSRKRFLGLLAAQGRDTPAGVEERAEGSLATAVAAMVAGAGLVRVHDVQPTVQAARLYGPAA